MLGKYQIHKRRWSKKVMNFVDFKLEVYQYLEALEEHQGGKKDFGLL